MHTPPCRAVAEGTARARSDVAKVELALEATARETMRAATERIRCELYDGLDLKTKMMVGVEWGPGCGRCWQQGEGQRELQDT